MIDDVGLRWVTAMRQGAFEAAHAISDAVLASRNPSLRDDPRLPYHLRWVWDGSELAGRHVLVRCYHGLGDTIQFARFLPVLRRRAASVSVEAQPELLGLLGTMPGIDRLIPFRPDRPARPAERDVEIMELAHALRLGPEATPPPYLAAELAPVTASLADGRRHHEPNPKQSRAARESSVAHAGLLCFLPDDAVESSRACPGPSPQRGLNIGLCWRAGDWDPARSVPLSALRAACDAPLVHLWSLQLGRADAVRPAISPGADVMATASAIAALDLVVTVDTMVAHLAGALGKQTCLLLRRECDWRWMEGRANSPWYPSMRLYRQTAEGDWRAPLAQLASDLRLRSSEAEC